MVSRRAFLFSVAASTACNRSSGKRVIAVVPKGVNHIFWQSVHAGAIKAGQELDVEILWNAPQLEIDSSRQISIVENMITRQVDGIVLAPVDEDALVSVVDRAVAAGIPVAIFDSAINSDNIITYIATDNYEAGKMGGRRMGEILGGKGKVGVVGFMPGSASTMAREKGFIDAVAEEYPDIEVLDVRYNMADRAKALAEAENLMTANPDLTGLFADNESSTDGVVRAVKQRNAVGRVKIVGFDASQELVAEMKAGVIDSIIVQDPFRMGYESTHAMVKKLDGGEPLREVDSGSYLLTPDNVDSPELQAVVFPDLERWLGDGAGGH